MRQRTSKIALPRTLVIGLLIGGLIVSRLVASQFESSEESEEIVLPDRAQVDLADAT